MSNKTFRILNVFALAFLIAFTSCVNDLNTVPLEEGVFTSVDVYSNPENYLNVLAELYAGLAVGGQQDSEGMSNINGLYEGFGQYLCAYWCAQELPTDEALIAWNEGNLRDYHDMDWDSNNELVSGLYYRIFYQITLINEFIRETTTAKLDKRDISGATRSKIELYRSEARFLRALSYWHAIDLFANVPFVNEGDKMGSFFPKQISRIDLFKYIEAELLDIESKLTPAGQAEYGRADQGAAWMLLAKLYLNAEVYIQQDYYTECVEYCNKIIEAGYSLDPDYEHLFLADNHTSPEIIFPITQDGIHTKTWGGTTFIIHAAVGGSMDPAEFGIDEGGDGLRVTPQFVGKFLNSKKLSSDVRGMFYTEGQTLEIDDIFEFTHGYAVTKWKNITSTGQSGSDLAHADTDFPLFRLADVYLMYAEAVLRGAEGGDSETALNYINMIRERAYGDTVGNVTEEDMTLDFILDERAREFYWEAQRRTDLIRFGKFTGSDYNWAWKGAVKEGKSIDTKFKIYPIPATDVIANPNLTQNHGY